MNMFKIWKLQPKDHSLYDNWLRTLGFWFFFFPQSHTQFGISTFYHLMSRIRSIGLVILPWVPTWPTRMQATCISVEDRWSPCDEMIWLSRRCAVNWDSLQPIIVYTVALGFHLHSTIIIGRLFSFHSPTFACLTHVECHAEPYFHAIHDQFS